MIVAAILLVIILGVTLLMVVHLRREAHDMRNLAIYNNIAEKIMKQSMQGDVPREEALVLLNAARETYNESIRGSSKHIQETKFPEVHLDEVVRASSGDETHSPRQKSKRKEPSRPARSDLDNSS